ncbi:hypothetical protein [Pseudidiomarina sp.]|uniref:hypothetical protein n=1 Tax=Pseudidiomarina sp. TaxID=2081707 RepID=UPI003A975DCD
MSGFVKTLIVSNNPMSNHLNNGKTLMSLFGDFSTSELSQVYLKKHRFHEPDIDSFEVSPTSIHYNPGRESSGPNNCLRELSIEESEPGTVRVKGRPSKMRRKNVFTLLIRDLLYLPVAVFAAFKTRRHILSKNVERVFWVYSDFLSMHLYLYLLKRLSRVRVDVFFTDDYLFEYTQEVEGSVAKRKGYYGLLYLSTKQMAKFFTKCFVISEKMAGVYEKELGVVSEVLLNPTEIECNSFCLSDKSYELRYFGSLHSGRFNALIQVAKEVNKFNLEADAPDLNVCVYTSTMLTCAQMSLAESHGVHIFKPVTGRAYLERVCSAFGLLLLESSSEENLKDTWLSCSTKVPEYLSSQRPIIAWGPIENPSIEVVVKSDSCIYLNDGVGGLLALYDKLKMANLTARAASIYRAKFSCEVMREKVKE